MCRTSDVLAMCDDERGPSHGYQLIDRLIRFMRGLKDEGRYMLVHPPGTSAVMCYQALYEDNAEVCAPWQRCDYRMFQKMLSRICWAHHGEA